MSKDLFGRLVYNLKQELSKFHREYQPDKIPWLLLRYGNGVLLLADSLLRSDDM